MLEKFSAYKNVYVEITKSEHKHGGLGWEFGTCLWTPSQNRAGGDRYSLMREPRAGDLVLHFYHDTWPDGLSDTRLCGRSVVAGKFRKVDKEPPSPGNWGGMSPYYRIDLTDYAPFEKPLPLTVLVGRYADEIGQDLEENWQRFYPFNFHGDTIQTVQGIYLAKCTPQLYLIIKRALGLEANVDTVGESEFDPHKEYSEAKRLCKERYFFARNRFLVMRAKELYGYTCQICGFNFKEKYGGFGEGYIECHHLNPFSERSEGKWSEEIRSRLEDVIVLCANCHRMIHHQKPALSVPELKEIVDSI